MSNSQSPVTNQPISNDISNNASNTSLNSDQDNIKDNRQKKINFPSCIQLTTTNQANSNEIIDNFTNTDLNTVQENTYIIKSILKKEKTDNHNSAASNTQIAIIQPTFNDTDISLLGRNKKVIRVNKEKTLYCELLKSLLIVAPLILTCVIFAPANNLICSCFFQSLPLPASVPCSKICLMGSYCCSKTSLSAEQTICLLHPLFCFESLYAPCLLCQEKILN